MRQEQEQTIATKKRFVTTPSAANCCKKSPDVLAVFGFSPYTNNGLQYYFAETTAPGWILGEVSDTDPVITQIN